MSSREFPPFLDLPPVAAMRGAVRLPGSKSISNRTLLLAALAEGDTEILDLLDSDDTQRMLDALGVLGVKVSGEAGRGRVVVHGCGGNFPNREGKLFLGNAGTAFRPLTAALAVVGGRFDLSGVPRMHERPIGDLVTALNAMGAGIEYLGNDGFPPLRLTGGTVRVTGPVRVRGDVSSQFLTALLLALPMLGTGAEIEVEGELISKPYIDITLNLMARFGVAVGREGWARFRIPAGVRYVSPGAIAVEGDASGASYFLAAGVIGGGPVRVEGVGRDSIQGDVRFADALEAVGGHILRGDTWIEARAPASGGVQAFDLDLNHIPDAAMTLAVVALFANGPCRLRNIASWRVKETDRIAAMAAELRKVGASVEEGPDYLVVHPPQTWRAAAIETYDDHRMAMCLALATRGGIPLRILDPGCVAKTFPEFFDRLADVAVPDPVPVVAIDGPGASGKGTVARMVAEALGFRYLDSGSIYRVAALAARQAGLDLDDEKSVAALATGLDVTYRGEAVLLAGEDVTEAIRSEDVSQAASRIAALPALREALMWRQRAFLGRPGLVAEGRDIGSVVFPDATLKVYLTASAEERAARRHKQLIEKGMRASLSNLLQDLVERDARDSRRSVAPLGKAPGAVELDSTGIGAQDVCKRIVGWFRERTGL